MPIKPKYTTCEDRPVAQRQFTDREDFIKTFRSALDANQPDRHQVLVFYGVGGIGKTSLRKELTKLVSDQDGIASAVLDFETPGYRDMETALFALRKSLLARYKMHFPTFDIAYAVYWQKSRPQISMTGDNVSLLSDSVVLADLIAAAGVVPIIGVLPRLPYLLAKGRKVLQDWWVRRGSAALKELPTLEPQRIAERLPMFWASDLKDSLAAKHSRAVLFLDTYEALTESERSEGKLFQRDEWVRELVAQQPGVLWVICGRELLRWAELDPNWKESLDQHLIGGLADADARRFIKSCGIEDSGIADRIVSGSSGLPYYLDLAVDTYLEARRRGIQPSPTDFAHAPAEVFTRFLRHLTQPEVETLKVLSVPRFWDAELFESLVIRFNTGYPLTAFPDLCRFSFISQSTSKGTYSMHQLMQQSLQEHASPDLVKKVDHFLFELHDSQLKDIDIRNITTRQKSAFTEAFFHARTSLPQNDLLQWFLGPAGQFSQAGEWRLLVPLYTELAHDLESRLGSESIQLAQCLNNLAELLTGTGKWREAERLHRQALAIRRKTLGNGHPDVAQSLDNLGEVIGGVEGRYAEAEELFREALRIMERAQDPRRIDIAETQNNLAVILRLQRKYDQSEQVFLQSLSTREALLGPEHHDVAESLNNFAGLRWEQSRYGEAEQFMRQTLAILAKILPPEHPKVATALNNLAVIVRDQGRYAEAEPLFRQSLDMLEKLLGADHPQVAHGFGNLANLLNKQGKSSECESLARHGLATAEKVLGLDHPDVAVFLEILAESLVAQDKRPQAEQLYRRALAINEKAAGFDSPLCAKSLNCIARMLDEQNKHAEAESPHRRALAIWEKALGSDSPEVATGLTWLARTLTKLGKHAEAEGLLRRAVAILEARLGPDHMLIASPLGILADLCRQTGREAEGEKISARVKAIRGKT
jgi:tetratricopeptide (TPR) repeat protein